VTQKYFTLDVDGASSSEQIMKAFTVGAVHECSEG